jgi:hypothetical protein
MSSVTGIVVALRLQYQGTHPQPSAVQVIGIPKVGLVGNMSHVYVISCFHCKVDKNCAVLGCYHTRCIITQESALPMSRVLCCVCLPGIVYRSTFGM